MIPLNGAVICLLGMSLEDSFTIDLNSPIICFFLIIFCISIVVFPFKYFIDLLRGKK